MGKSIARNISSYMIHVIQGTCEHLDLISKIRPPSLNTIMRSCNGRGGRDNFSVKSP